MQTDEEFWADFDTAHKNYMELRTAKGFPLNKPEPGKPLPSWVLRNGERAKLTFVTRPHVDTKPAKSVNVPKPEPAKPVVVVEQPVAGASFASRVRVVIAEAKREGRSPEWVVEHAITAMGMKRTSAMNCVKHNWDRVK